MTRPRSPAEQWEWLRALDRLQSEGAQLAKLAKKLDIQVRSGDRDGYDFRLKSWGDGSSWLASGKARALAGTDATGLLHIRTFDPAGVRTDTYEELVDGAFHLVPADASGARLKNVPESGL